MDRKIGWRELALKGLFSIVAETWPSYCVQFGDKIELEEKNTPLEGIPSEFFIYKNEEAYQEWEKEGNTYNDNMIHIYISNGVFHIFCDSGESENLLSEKISSLRYP